MNTKGSCLALKQFTTHLSMYKGINLNALTPDIDSCNSNQIHFACQRKAPIKSVIALTPQSANYSLAKVGFKI